MATKRELLEMGFDHIGLGSPFDLSPEEWDSARKKLDSMMAQWNGRGLKLGYPIPTEVDGSDLDEDSGVPDAAHEAIALSIGERLALGFGKVITPQYIKLRREAMDALWAWFAKPVSIQLPGGFPLGAGNRSVFGPVFTSEPDDPVL